MEVGCCDLEIHQSNVKQNFRKNSVLSFISDFSVTFYFISFNLILVTVAETIHDYIEKVRDFLKIQCLAWALYLVFTSSCSSLLLSLLLFLVAGDRLKLGVVYVPA